MAAVPALITAPRHPGLPARASAGENKPRGRNPALRPGFAARLLRGQTKREAQLSLSEAYALPNESRPSSYAGVAPIPRQASTPPRANAGARQPPRKETRVGNFALMPARQPAPAPGRRRRKDCRRSPCSPACAYTRGCTQRISAGDPGRRMQRLLSECGVICCVLPDRATASWRGLSPETAADHPPSDKKAHGGGLARQGCYESTVPYNHASP